MERERVIQGFVEKVQWHIFLRSIVFISNLEWANNYAELVRLWGLLVFLVSFIQESHIQIMGDSKIVINWFNMKGSLQNYILEPWQQKISQLQESFEECTISHVYWEFNSIADSLSKEAFSSPIGILEIKELSPCLVQNFSLALF